MWKLATLVCVLVPSSAFAAKGGWRPGLTLKVHASIEIRFQGAGPIRQRATAEVRYRLRTAKDGSGFRVSIDDALLVSFDGDSDLKPRIARDVALLRSNPTFRVRKSGDFDGLVDGDATIETLRATFAADPMLATDNPTVLRQDLLELWLSQLWDSWRLLPRAADAVEVPLADGFIAKGTLSESRPVAAPCPGSRTKCRKYTRSARIDGEETRQHIEAYVRATGSPNTSVLSFVEEIKVDAVFDEGGLPVSAERTEEQRMDMAIGSHRRETVTVSTSRLTFKQ